MMLTDTSDQWRAEPSPSTRLGHPVVGSLATPSGPGGAVAGRGRGVATGDHLFGPGRRGWLLVVDPVAAAVLAEVPVGTRTGRWPVRAQSRCSVLIRSCRATPATGPVTVVILIVVHPAGCGPLFGTAPQASTLRRRRIVIPGRLHAELRKITGGRVGALPGRGSAVGVVELGRGEVNGGRRRVPVEPCSCAIVRGCSWSWLLGRAGRGSGRPRRSAKRSPPRRPEEMSSVEVRLACFASPARARSLFTVRAAISSARSSLRPRSFRPSLMCSYCRSRFALHTCCGILTSSIGPVTTQVPTTLRLDASD